MKTLPFISICVFLGATISCAPMDMPIRRDDFSYPGGTTGPKPIVMLSNSPDETTNPGESISTSNEELPS